VRPHKSLLFELYDKYGPAAIRDLSDDEFRQVSEQESLVVDDASNAPPLKQAKPA